MKKIIKLLTLGGIALTTCFSSTGCFASMYSREGKNSIANVCEDCLILLFACISRMFIILLFRWL